MEKDTKFKIGMFAVLILIILFMTCLVDPITKASKALKEVLKEQTRKEKQQLIANSLIQDSFFVKDTRTNPPVCFGYDSSSQLQATHATTWNVPCGSIPPELLITPNIE